jgi:signal transduction histidine kinase
MSVTRSSPPDASVAAPVIPGLLRLLAQPHWRYRRGVAVDAALAAFAVVMLAAMVAMPGEETLPYHLMFLAITLVYGFRVWPMAPAMLVVTLVTVSTGTVMYTHYLDEQIEAPELFEILLMPMLLLAMIWHARRRAAAQRQVEQMAEERRRSLEREREFLRDASHAIRTPVTIARGHVELIQSGLDQTTAQQDSEVVLRQLDRMHALSSRLLALARLDSGQALPVKPLELNQFVGQTAANWTGGADRAWAVKTGGGRVGADREWLELAVDAIVENAVHFTVPGDRIELACEPALHMSTITVTDFGAGIAQEDLPHVFDRFWHRRPPGGMPGSGLGLAMAMAAVHAMGGSLAVSSTLGEGARFTLSLPNAR